MLHFSGDYYIYNNELYKKIKPVKDRYYITNKQRKRKWITMKKIMEIINNK